ncbi:MAG: NAD kinase [Bacteroidetes bacterium]|nr:NAD kinase [Bacteroidota bacterium]
MNIALFGKTVTDTVLPFVQELVDALYKLNGVTLIYQPFYESLVNRIIFQREPVLFSKQSEIEHNVDFLLSIGGDGTILDAVGLIGNSGIPVTGINMGRLGFLSSISKERILPAIEAIQNGSYQIEKRTLLRLDAPELLFGPINYALNDLTVSKPNVMSILTIKTWINGEFLNAYWADGLIVATPTGSTAYSLSCTGPIITPDSETFLITPIASHNLTVRPIIIRDDSEIRIRVEGKNSEFLVSLDSRTEKVDHSVELVIRKESFKINLLRLTDKNFFQTIREKLNWGLDNRN